MSRHKSLLLSLNHMKLNAGRLSHVRSLLSSCVWSIEFTMTALPFFILFIASYGMAGAMIPSISEYFPELATDITQIEWAHATNSQKLLEEGLNNATIHMLEADIVLGFLNNGTEVVPIMGHPPANTSDLSLQQFVQSVIDFQSKGKKGIKLDFKSNDAYNASWSVLKQLQSQLSFPVWINADILEGPGHPTSVPLDGHQFLTLCKENFPDALISPGWTTQAQIGGAEYTEEQISAMKAVLEEVGVKQPVTFPVRANFAARSGPILKNLVADVNKYQGSNTTTLTVWMSSNTDLVDTTKLRTLILTLGKEKVALDVPQRIRDALHLTGTASPVTIAQGALVAVLSSVSAAINKVGSLF